MQLRWLALAVPAACAPVVVLYTWWRRDVHRRLSERRLSLKVERAGRQLAKTAPNSAGLLFFLELDEEVAASPTLSHMRLASLGSYFASLAPKGNVCLERAIVSAADKYGLAAALPLAIFLPPQWRQDDDVLGLMRSFPSLAAGRFAASALSTLDLVAFGHTVHQFAFRQRRHQAQMQAAAEGELAAEGTQQQQQQQQEEEAERLEELKQRKQVEKQLKAPGGDAAKRAANATLKRALGPLDILRRGAAPQRVDGRKLAALPNPLLLTRDSVAALLGLGAEDEAPGAPHPASPAPPPVSKLLPDLCTGNGGLPLTHSAAGAAKCALMAAVANRLAANALQGLAPAADLLAEGAPLERFVVRLEEGGPDIDSVEGLLDALAASGHAVRLRLISNLTSFGYGLCVKEDDGGYVHLPIAYPLRTGLWACDATGRQVDVLTLMSHASLVLNVAGPAIDFDLEWCLSIDGFTGWLSMCYYQRDWAGAPEFQVEHPLGALSGGGECGASTISGVGCGSGGGAAGSSPTGGGGEVGKAAQPAPAAAVEPAPHTSHHAKWRLRRRTGDGGGGGTEVPAAAAAERTRVVRLLTAASCVLNAAGQRDRLLFGGYGYLGVCLDSCAAIQCAIIGRTTLYPLILGGESKMGLLDMYRRAAAGGWAYATEAAALKAAIRKLPCDAMLDPMQAADAAQRALDCMPQRSVFAAVKHCRRLLESARDAAVDLASGDGKRSGSRQGAKSPEFNI